MFGKKLEQAPDLFLPVKHVCCNAMNASRPEQPDGGTVKRRNSPLKFHLKVHLCQKECNESWCYNNPLTPNTVFALVSHDKL